MSIALKPSPFDWVSPQELAQQLSGRKKAREKLPSWHETPGIYYPPGLNLEQASSEQTAAYKAGLVSGEWLVDLTGGFGVDSTFFARRVNRVEYCEIDPELALIAAHNFQVLGATNVRVHAVDGLEYIRMMEGHANRPSWIYADPSRRHQTKGKVIRLEDYTPEIPQNLDLLLQATDNLLLKTAPMLDIRAGLASLEFVREVHVVAWNNEVRELLWILQKGFSGEPRIKALDLADGMPPFTFTLAEEAASVSRTTPLAKYLYEPGAALLKAGAFKLVGDHYELGKLHRHTHLYTSDALIPFPGRRFRVLRSLPYKPGRLPFRKGHVNSRNFPEDVAKIRKRNRIRSGGDTYLFFIRLHDESLQVVEAKAV
ncbi:class I SAM-dependent methyltransferase [Robiginitalea sp. SC105]|uniref:class I SAM-dependent methyltransferase n=1 Tax=Robiginitalea sp. SC105 TaxID=2762332 RepID=UPI0021082393|nr:class I SAM-dependent methyltransferase [Robiginitalea sp. SC105]